MRGTQRSLLHVRLMGSWVRTWSFTQWRRARCAEYESRATSGLSARYAAMDSGHTSFQSACESSPFQMRWIFSSVMRRSVSLVNSWKCLHAPLKGLVSGE